MNLRNFPQYWKAALGFVMPAVSVIAVAVTPGSEGGTSITGHEWFAAGLAAVLTAGGVYLKSNAPATPAAQTAPTDGEA